MASQVTYTNLFSESRNNVVALITSSNVPDPTIASTEYRKWIYSRQPDVKATDFSGYPYLIVYPASVNINEGGSVDMKSKMVDWAIEIAIVTSDRGYGGNDGKGLSHMDDISDDLIKTFMNKTNRNTLITNSMQFTRPEVTDVVTEPIGDELTYRRSILLNFKSRIQVSA